MGLRFVISCLAAAIVPQFVEAQSSVMSTLSLHNVHTHSAELRWEGEPHSRDTIYFGTSPTELYPHPLLARTYQPLPRGGKSGEWGVFSAQLKGLSPGTRYYYILSSRDRRQESLQLSPNVLSFSTLQENPQRFSFLAMSDAQHGWETSTRVVRESVLTHAFSHETHYPVEFALFPGDLVQHGDIAREWHQHWFQPLSPLLKKISVYPAIGNHEKNDPRYFTYFNLPRNGMSVYEGHWYTFTRGPVCFISLDTNSDYRLDVQLDWLQQVLEAIEQDPAIHFVVAQNHHPYLSEAWLEGESVFSGKIFKALEKFSKKSGKPSFHLYGHTHGYSRGHSFQARTTMLNVAALGGAIDNWGEYPQRDYNEFVISFAGFGWLRFYVDDGAAPSIHVERYSFGGTHTQGDQGIVDSFTIPRFATTPLAPSITMLEQLTSKEIGTRSLRLTLSRYSDKSGASHLTTQVELCANAACTGDRESIYINRYNHYYGSDRNEGLDLCMLEIPQPEPSYSHLRVRYRNSALVYSAWSTPVKLPRASRQ